MPNPLNDPRTRLPRLPSSLSTAMYTQLPRILILLVLIWNLQSAGLFLFRPADYVAGFELSGVVGRAMLQGMGLLFVMWNVPYVVALTHPYRHRISLYEAIAMQVIGFIGEAILAFQLPPGPEHAVLRGSVLRFMIFDGAGLALLLLTLYLVSRPPHVVPGGE